MVQFGPRPISPVLERTRSGSKLFWIPWDVRNLKTPILDPDSYPIVPSTFSKQVHESWTWIGSTGPESGPSGILRVKEFNDTTKHLGGKMQSQFLLDKQRFKDSYDNQHLLEDHMSERHKGNWLVGGPPKTCRKTNLAGYNHHAPSLPNCKKIILNLVK